MCQFGVRLRGGMILWVLAVLWVVVVGCQRKPVAPVTITPAASSAAATRPMMATATATETAVPTRETPVDFWTVSAERLVVADGVAYVAIDSGRLLIFEHRF